MSPERVLQAFPRTDAQRLLVVVREKNGIFETLLRQESRSDTGWFVQSEIVVNAEQVAGLKSMFSTRSTQEICPEVSAKRDVIPIGQYLTQTDVFGEQV